MNRKKSSKWIALVVVILFIGMNAIPSTAIKETTRNEKVGSSRDTIYVDDDNTEGPWDGTIEHPYQFVPEGIYHAEAGDTVYVFSGIYHNQDAFIDKPINLIGEDKETTIMWTHSIDWIVEIHADNVNVSGFTFRNKIYTQGNQKMYIGSDYCTISDNIFADDFFVNCRCTLYMNDAHHNIITRNIFGNDKIQNICIKLENSNHNIFSENIIQYQAAGIGFSSSNSNEFINNTIINTGVCMGLIDSSSSNVISGNLFCNYLYGISIVESSNNEITYNRFENVTRGFSLGQFYFGRHVIFHDSKNTFDQNYWGRGRILPKIIFGYKTVNGKQRIDFQVDWHPARN